MYVWIANIQKILVLFFRLGSLSNVAPSDSTGQSPKGEDDGESASKFAFPITPDKAFVLLFFYSQKKLGPVVQSVVSLTSLLRVIPLTVLADSIHNILIFFAEKMWVAFALQKLLTFFQQNISAYLRIT